jgi:signal transduction histidine kinase
LDELLWLLMGMSKGKKIHIQYEHDERLNNPFCQVQLDKLLFHVLVSNVVSNSIDGSESNATIVIKTNLIDDKAIMSIKDSGSGVENDDRKKVFHQPFSTKNGSGTGLIHVKECCRRMGIDCPVLNSEVGRGTTVTIEWPLSSERPEQ